MTNKRYYVHKIKKLSSDIDIEQKIQDQKIKPKPISEVNSVIDLNKDSKRKEIGFDTESVTDKEWKEIRIDWNKLLSNYAKLSKKNLTGKNQYQLIKKITIILSSGCYYYNDGSCDGSSFV